MTTRAVDRPRVAPLLCIAIAAVVLFAYTAGRADASCFTHNGKESECLADAECYWCETARDPNTCVRLPGTSTCMSLLDTDRCVQCELGYACGNAVRDTCSHAPRVRNSPLLQVLVVLGGMAVASTFASNAIAVFV